MSEKRNNNWTSYHLQLAAKSLLREVMVKAYRTINPELNDDSILGNCCVIGDFSKHSLVRECERLLALMQARGLSCASFPDAPRISFRYMNNTIDRLLD